MVDREIPKQESENLKLVELIKEYDQRFGHILGYRRMTSWVNRFNHTAYGKKRVHRIMKKLGIQSVIRKKKKICIFSPGNNRRKQAMQGFLCVCTKPEMVYRCN